MPFRSDRKSTRLNSSHLVISYAVFCLKKKKTRTPSFYSFKPPDANIPDHLVCALGPCATVTTVRRLGNVANAGVMLCFFFFFNDTATTEIYTLSLHDALPI